MVKSITLDNLRKSRLGKISELLCLDLLGDGCFLAGGSLRTLIKPSDPIQDYDLFFSNKERVSEIRALLKAEKYKNVFSCPEEKMFSYKKENTKIQLICENFAPPKETIELFDFHACQAAFDGEKLYFSLDWARNVLSMNLTTNVITYPVASIKRLIKYKEKGYNITNAAIGFMHNVSGKTFEGDELRVYID